MLRRSWALCLVLVAMLAPPVLMLAERAAAESSGRGDRPTAFAVRGSHGFRVYVEPWKDKVLVTASKEGASVTYTAPADITATSIRADLGKFGAVDMKFKSNGRLASKRPPGCDFKLRASTGTFRGRFRFTGEGGYVKAQARLANWSFRPLELGECLRVQDQPGPSGVLEVLKRFADRSRVYLNLSKTGPDGPAYFGSTITEKHSRIGIERTVLAVGSPMSFTYSTSGAPPAAWQTDGHVQPPPGPFSGEAIYHAEAPGPGQFTQSWTGTLAARFPGSSLIPLTGLRYESGLNVEF